MKALLSTLAGLGLSVFAVLGVVGCCGLPIVAGLLSMLGVGAAQLTFLAQYSGWILAFSVAALAFGFYRVYGAKTSCCASEGANKEGWASGRGLVAQKVLLWLGAALVATALIAGRGSSTTPATAADGSATVGDGGESSSVFCGTSCPTE